MCSVLSYPQTPPLTQPLSQCCSLARAWAEIRLQNCIVLLGGGDMATCMRLPVGFGRLCSKKKHIMLSAVLIFFRNYAKIMLLSENYALCHRNYAT